MNTQEAAEPSLADRIREIVKQGVGIGLLVGQAKAAKLLDYEESTLETWRHNGIGPRYVASETGRFLGYRLEAIETWLREREVGSAAEAREKKTHQPRNRKGKGRS